MGKKTIKFGHWASQSYARSSKAEKEEILRLYARLEGRERFVEPYEVPVEFQDAAAEEKIDIGGLIAQMRSDSDELVIEAIKRLERAAEYNVPDVKRAIPATLEILRKGSNADVRYEATKAAAKIKDPGAIDALIVSVEHDPSEKVREGAVKALGLIRAGGCAQHLITILNDVCDQPVRVRKAAAFALGRLNPSVTVNILCDSLISDPDAEVRCEAAESIAVCLLKLEKNEAGAIVQTISSQIDFEIEAEHEVRIAVINAVTVAESIICVDPLIAAMRADPNPRVRGQAANAMAHFFDPRVEKALIESLEKEKGDVKKRIALALAHYAMRNPLSLHDDVCDALIHIQKLFPRQSYIWKEAVKALPAC